MKYLFFAIALTVSIISYAQEGTEETDVFVRVYDLQNKMIGKGNMISISDAFLQLKERIIHGSNPSRFSPGGYEQDP